MKKQNIIVWLVIGLGMVFVYNASRPNNNVTPVPYSSVEKDISKISSFELRSDERSFLYTLANRPTEVFSSTFPTRDHATRAVDNLIDRGIPLHVEPPETQSLMGMFLISVFPVLLLIAALVWLYKRNSGSGGALAFGKSPATLVDDEKNTVRLADVAGNPGDFDDIYEIIDFLKDPSKYHAANAKLPKGMLMYGPPGVGKTLLARAIAGEAGVPFFTINGSAFVEMFVGVGAARIRDMFANLRAHQPAILFIDEIDALGGIRSPEYGGGGGHREAEQTLNQLLTEMDGFDNDDAIMVIAATNRPDTLDPALLRPGRFDRKIPIGLPDINARKKILEVHTTEHTLADDVKLDVIAKGTPGMSGADLANLVNEAAMLIGKDNRTMIEMKDLDAARDKIYMGREKSLAMNKEEKEMTAYHEAGHAIAAYDSPGHDPVYKITIIPRDRALGVTMYLPEEDTYSITHKQLRAQLISLMGGRAAEEVTYGGENISTGASNDLERATELARNMITKWGFSETGLISFRDHDYKLLSDDTKEQIDIQIRQLLKESYEKAKSILQNRKDKLIATAEALIDKETINFEEFKEIMEDEQLPL